MLTHFRFAHPPLAGLEIPLSPFTLFVGDMGAGKSRALAEIEYSVSAMPGDWGPSTPSRIECDLKTIFPDIQGVEWDGLLLVALRIGDQSFSFRDCGEGAQSVAYHLLEVYGEHELFVCDNLEGNLHPRAQRLWVSVLRQIQRDQSPLQILATTNSPFVMDSFDASEILVFGMKTEGGPRACKPLSAHPAWKALRFIPSCGEFWWTECQNDAWLFV